MSTVPAYSHVVVVVEENENYDNIAGNTTQAPYINSLMTGGASWGGGSDFNHDPCVSFPEGSSVQTDFTSFPALFPNGSYSSLPGVSFVVRSDTNDMHCGTIQYADSCHVERVTRRAGRPELGTKRQVYRVGCSILPIRRAT
jgi:hypothetical protein